MKNIHFIVNPIAGKGNKNIDQKLLDGYFPKALYILVIKYTKYKGEAVVLTQESVSQGADIIVACGGDGTINEVASVLVNSQCILGIIPIGSGNGLASHLNIPKNIEKALMIIKHQVTNKIDVGICNGNYFFSNTGFGFDAKVIRNYEGFNGRTLKSYLKACAVTFFNDKKDDSLVVTINGTKMYKDPFLIFASNSNELGYNFSLTPKASLKDGLLDVLIIPKMQKLQLVWFGIMLIFKRHLSIKGVVSYQTNKLDIIRNKGKYLESQMDGEYKILEEIKVSIELLKDSIIVIN
ncbi:diacylglycerol/lipid kinase family protein [Galbibacter pacificus]|uniref:YegS/Rv2252/BmrU family lipid kinase n=1 Tax=Galbibacter pacificus TaxID=2996052 RepID=A0ABT6FWH4_9FLAO|nr:YegS/Rv2252/BmrU family lipid kinase [Galbibacter pacificus]MDG3583947.1 YegS/Rv2252/BmrU family lipid kinase [Galbibacter pacificus]MDG3587615.1 YegS/Rv2252/BmrU family lipid kinase [Galbibacter pacificus]